MIPKSVKRSSEKFMLNNELKLMTIRGKVITL